MPKYGHLFYTKIYDNDLELFVEHDVSKQGQRLYIFLSLNFHTYNENTEYYSDSEIADALDTHRTTIMRARAELEDAKLIVPTEDTRNQRTSYHLPMKAKINSHAAKKADENRLREKEREFDKRRQEMENDLKRRLTRSEILSVK